MFAEAPADDRDALEALLGVLREALLALAESGDPEAACRLAGRSYAALRHEHPAEAQRVNVLMHRLTRIPPTPKEP